MKNHPLALALGLSLLCNALPGGLLTTSTALAEEAAKDVRSQEAGGKPEATSKTETVAIDAKADAVLHKMSDFYSGLKVFHTTMSREGGSRDLTYKIEAEKPNKLSIEIISGGEHFRGSMTKMDGQKLCLYNPILGFVASKAPANYDELVRDREFQFAMVHVMHGQNFLEALLTDKPYDFIIHHYGIAGGELIGEEKIDGVETQHVRLNSERMTYDLWVESGSKPWIRQVSTARKHRREDQSALITYKYSKQSDSTKIAASDFAFHPPSGAKQVDTFVNAVKEEEKQATAPKTNPSHEGSEPEQAQLPSPRAHAPHPLLNKPAPQISLETIESGKLDLESLKSKNVVVLDFWATWCPPCREALPIIAEVTKSYESKGVKFFAIDLRENKEKVEEFLKKQGLNINVAIDQDGSAAEKYGVEGIPQSVIIGKDGIVRVVHVGLRWDLKTRLAAELDQVLEGKEVSSQ